GNITDEYIFFNGKRIARRHVNADASSTIFYYFADHLGTSRVIVQEGQATACYDADFYPFGGERVVTNICPQNYKFTAKERDPESSLDYFGARYYSSAMGRFTSSDSLSDSNHPGTPFSSAHYNAAGSLLSARLGNGISETRTYDPRLRLTSISDGPLYSLTIPASGGYAPNSDILSANDSINGNWTYTYDDFNRLLTANATGQAYAYDYDRVGNRCH